MSSPLLPQFMTSHLMRFYLVLAKTPVHKPLVFPNIVDPVHIQPAGEDQIPIQEEVQIILMDALVLPQLHDTKMVT